MNERMNSLVTHLNNGGNGEAAGGLSTGERCFVALATNRYDLLPANYADPIEAWQRLELEEQLQVCEWRGWPEHYANG